MKAWCSYFNTWICWSSTKIKKGEKTGGKKDHLLDSIGLLGTIQPTKKKKKKIVLGTVTETLELKADLRISAR